MILVTVGTHRQGFDRLVQPMDELTAVLGEQVVIQRGSSTYEPRHAEHFQWTTSQRMEQLTQTARVVVTHAAAGAILLALHHRRPLVVIPRSRRCGEHVDDHQYQLARALDAAGKAVAVFDPTAARLRTAIEQASQLEAESEGPGKLVCALRRQLALWSCTGAAAKRTVDGHDDLA